MASHGAQQQPGSPSTLQHDVLSAQDPEAASTSETLAQHQNYSAADGHKDGAYTGPIPEVAQADTHQSVAFAVRTKVMCHQSFSLVLAF